MKRLRQIVVGAHLEADDAVHRLAAAGQDDDADVRFLAQLAREREPVLARQHKIEDDEIDRILRHDLAHAGAVMCDTDAVALARQILLDDLADLFLVVHNDDVARSLSSLRNLAQIGL